jgi:CBS-domain-containing membrane protein
MHTHTVGDVMADKVVTIRESTGFKDIVAAFGRHAVSAAPVVTDDGAVLGIVTESDLIRKVGYAGVADRADARSDDAKADAVTAGGLMTAPAVTVNEQETVARAARLMSAEHLRRMPVIDDTGQLVGMVSARDLLRSFLRDDESIVREIREQVLAETLWIDPSRITVKVQDGVVTLLGTVDRRSTIGLVTHLVGATAGVVQVVNHLTYHYDDEQDRVRPARPQPL